jgi:hypothetical protein
MKKKNISKQIALTPEIEKTIIEGEAANHQSHPDIEGTVDGKADVELPKELSRFVNPQEGMGYCQVVDLYKEQLAKLAGKVPEVKLTEFAIVGVQNEIRKDQKRKEGTFKPKAEAMPIVGFIVTDTGLWDKIQNIQQAAQAFVKKNGMATAIRDQYVDGDGHILDKREKLFGKPNPNYLKPLKEGVVDASRTLGLIAKIGNDDSFKYGTIQTNNAALARGWSKVKFYIPCQTFGIIKSNEKDGFFKANSSEAEETTSVFKALKEFGDVDKIFLDVINPQLTEIANVERVYELIKEAYDRTLFVKGRVAWIGRERPNNWGAIRMGIMDDDNNEIVVSIPEHIGKDFGELSQVIVIGKPDRGDLKVTDEKTGKSHYERDKGDVYLQAIGIYVLARTPEDVYSSNAGSNEEIEGWLS